MNEFLAGFFEPGDLVLIKGSKPDGLSGVVSAWLQGPDQRGAAVPSDLEGSSSTLSPTRAPDAPPAGPTLDRGVRQMVVGLGNPGTRFDKTPHNVGQRALDLVAESLGLAWSEEDFGLIAKMRVREQEVVLIKPAIQMNITGPWMRQLADSAELLPDACLVLHDDINLKPGVVRNRMSGSSGGHKGMQSIIAAFQTEDIRRVKIGVGAAPEGMPVSRYVLSPIEASKVDTVEDACRVAATRVLEMLTAHAVSISATEPPS